MPRVGKLTVEQCQKLSIKDLNLSGLDVPFIELDRQEVLIAITKCYFGGERLWFACPQCKKLKTKLYRKPGNSLFLCRVCQNLTYDLRTYHRSSNEQFLRLIKQLNSI